MLFKEEGGDEDEDVNDSPIVKFCRKFIDVSDEYDGDNFFTIQVSCTSLLLLVSLFLSILSLLFG